MSSRCPSCSREVGEDGVLRHVSGCEAGFLAGPDEPCVFCGETPRTGWNQRCANSPNGLHDSLHQLMRGHEEERAVLGRYLSRAAFELDKVAATIEQLPARQRRRLPVDLSPELIRNEAERARDGLHVHRLLDV